MHERCHGATLVCGGGCLSRRESTSKAHRIAQKVKAFLLHSRGDPTATGISCSYLMLCRCVVSATNDDVCQWRVKKSEKAHVRRQVRSSLPALFDCCEALSVCFECLRRVPSSFAHIANAGVIYRYFKQPPEDVTGWPTRRTVQTDTRPDNGIVKLTAAKGIICSISRKKHSFEQGLHAEDRFETAIDPH